MSAIVKLTRKCLTKDATRVDAHRTGTSWSTDHHTPIRTAQQTDSSCASSRSMSPRRQWFSASSANTSAAEAIRRSPKDSTATGYRARQPTAPNRTDTPQETGGRHPQSRRSCRIRFVRATADRIIRSRRPAHPQIVSVEQFTEAHLIRRGRAGITNRDRAKLDRTRTLIPRPYLLRGHIRCDICNRKMQAELVGSNIYYRCRARTLAPGSKTLTDHPKTVGLRESVLIDPLDGWLSKLFDHQHRNRTIEILLAAQETDDTDALRALLRRRIAEADTKLQRHMAAIEAGVDPAAFVSSMNAAQAEKAAARAELDAIPKPIRLTETEMHKLIESAGDIRAVLQAGAPEDKKLLYETRNVQIRYQHRQQLAVAGASLPGFSTGVRRGTHALNTRIDLRK